MGHETRLPTGQHEYTETLLQEGYVRGQANACLFHTPSTNVAVMVHGDDFVAVGHKKGLAGIRRALEGKNPRLAYDQKKRNKTKKHAYEPNPKLVLRCRSGLFLSETATQLY